MVTRSTKGTPIERAEYRVSTILLRFFFVGWKDGKG